MALQGIQDPAAIERQIVRTFSTRGKSVRSATNLPHTKKIEYSEPDGRGKKKMPKRLEVVYPLPENRREYLPLEAVTYLQSLHDGRFALLQCRSGLTNAWSLPEQTVL
jgi:hypothetical protein